MLKAALGVRKLSKRQIKLSFLSFKNEPYTEKGGLRVRFCNPFSKTPYGFPAKMENSIINRQVVQLWRLGLESGKNKRNVRNYAKQIAETDSSTPILYWGFISKG